MFSATVTKCAAEALGIMLPAAGTISYAVGDTKSFALLRAISFSAAQFGSCMAHTYEDTNEDSTTKAMNSVTIGSIKYSAMNFFTGKDFSPIKALFGAYNDISYRFTTDISNITSYYLGENVGFIYQKLSPILIEASESALQTTLESIPEIIIETALYAAMGQQYQSTFHSNLYENTILGAEVGFVVAVTGETIYPAMLWLCPPSSDVDVSGATAPPDEL